MAVLEIVAGCLLIVAAVCFLIGTFVDANLVWLGVAVILGAGAYVLVDRGWHSENVKFRAKHAAIVGDLRAQGIAVDDGDVNARGGWSYIGTEADLTLGGCRVPFVAAKVDGRWRLALPNARTGPNEPRLRLLAPADLDKIAEVCP